MAPQPFHSIRAPNTTNKQPNTRVSVWLLRLRIRSLPNQAATAEARPTAATIFQSMRLLARALLSGGGERGDDDDGHRGGDRLFVLEP